MVLSGTTTFNDMYFFPEQSAQAAVDIGARIVAGMTLIEFPTRYADHTAQYIERGLKAKTQFQDHPTVHWSIAPHAPYTVSDPTFSQVLALSNAHNIPIHCHLHETASEVQDAVSRDGFRPFERLERLGLINPRFLAIHGVHLNDEELAHMAQAGATLVHCPSSNLKLASGFAPTAKALAAGVNVVIGTDGAASNNKLDMWEEARLASLLCKGHSGDATAWPAGQLLLSMTAHAAKALGLEHDTGRIAVGLKADLIAIELGKQAHQLPNHNLISKLAYSGSARDVQHVWINGVQVVHAQQLTGQRAELLNEIMLKTQRLWQTRVEKVGRAAKT
jgi:5-methylthioadenosine/S-adenosylhomocysteine deaminase